MMWRNIYRDPGGLNAALSEVVPMKVGPMKVFGLGLARTGTTTMHEAMLALDLRSAPSSAHLIDGFDLAFFERFDAFFDNPIPFMRTDIEGRFEDARFIVTWRPEDEWVESMRWLFGPGLDRLDRATRRLGDRVHRAVYGIDTFDADVLRSIYSTHYDELRRWSAGRDDVLWIGSGAGVAPFGWEALCGFLGRPIPDVPFPHANSRTEE